MVTSRDATLQLTGIIDVADSGFILTIAYFGSFVLQIILMNMMVPF